MADDFSKYKNKQKILRIIGLIFALVYIYGEFKNSKSVSSLQGISIEEIILFGGIMFLLSFGLYYIFSLALNNTKEIERFYFEGGFLIITRNNPFLTSDGGEGKVNQALARFIAQRTGSNFPIKIDIKKIKEIKFKKSFFTKRYTLSLVWLDEFEEYQALSLKEVGLENKNKLESIISS